MITQKDINRRQRQFQQKAINEQISPPRQIQTSAFLYGESSSEKNLLATVIVCPTYPDKTANPQSPEYAGISYYTVRFLRNQNKYNIWSNETEYGLNAEVVYPGSTGRLYKSKIAENKGNQPDTSPDQWELMEEIKIEHAVDAEMWQGSTGVDVWNNETEYSLNAEVAYPDLTGWLYKSKIAENIGNQPDTHPGQWEAMEVIKNGYYNEGAYAIDPTNHKVYIAIVGNMNYLPSTSSAQWKLAPEDLKYCIPRIGIGRIVRLTKRTIGQTVRYFINQPFTYIGKPEEASIQWDSVGGFAKSVYR